MRHLFILFILLCGCDEPGQGQVEKTVPSKEENEREFAREFGVTKLNWADYHFHFYLNDSTLKEYQYLGIRFNTDQSISYHIFRRSELCEMAFRGKAQQDLPFDGKVFKRNALQLPDGLSYFEKRGEVVVEVQLNRDTSMATVEFRRPAHPDECDPFAAMVLRRHLEANDDELTQTGQANPRYDELINPDERTHFLVSEYNTDNPDIPNIERPTVSVIQTQLDTALLFGFWAHESQAPHATFDFNSRYMYYVDFDGNGAMPYELKGNHIRIYYPDFIWEGEIISVTRDKLKMRAKGSEEIAVLVPWKE